MHSVVGWMLRKFRRRHEDNTKMYLTERAMEGLNSIVLAQSRDQWPTVVNMIMRIRFL